MKKYIDEWDWEHYSLETLLYFVKKYDDRKSTLNKIKEAYKFAAKKHINPDGSPVLRKSGDPYITHPTAVANMLAIEKMDVNSICAGLLHDTIEDTDATFEEIEEKFGTDVAELVLGVTKYSGIEEINLRNLTKRLGNDEKENLALLNSTKLTDDIPEDPRRMIIKLADRTHNMLTIKYKTRIKQREKALETLAFYVPIANKFGMYRIQQILEDTSFQVLAPKLYKDISDAREQLKLDNLPFMEQMLQEMKEVIKDNVRIIGHLNMSETIGKTRDDLVNKVLSVGPKYSRVRIKHIFGIYEALLKLRPNKEQDIFEYFRNLEFNEETLDKIHDLRVIKLIVKDEDSCFLLLRYLHKKYHHVDKYLKDYITEPKSNGYQSIHTTVVVDGKFVQFQIRTKDQELRNTYGFAWELYKLQGPNTRARVVEAFKKNPAYKKLLEIKGNSAIRDLAEYKSLIDRELLNRSEIIVINKATGTTETMIDGSTIHDFAYAVGGERGKHLVGAIVNDVKYELVYKNGKVDEEVYPFGLLLKNGDEISVEFNDNIICPRPKENSIENNTNNNVKKLKLIPEEKKEN